MSYAQFMAIVFAILTVVSAAVSFIVIKKLKKKAKKAAEEMGAQLVASSTPLDEKVLKEAVSVYLSKLETPRGYVYLSLFFTILFLIELIKSGSRWLYE